MTSRIENVPGDAVDALLATLAATVVAGLLFVVWIWSAGRYAAEPSPVTAATAPGATAVIATIEEDSP